MTESKWTGRVLNAVLAAVTTAGFIMWQKWPDESDMVCRMSEVQLVRAQSQLQKKVNAGFANVNDCEMLEAYHRALKRIAAGKDDVDNALADTTTVLTITNSSSVTQYVKFPSPYIWSSPHD